ncbi:MAG: DUF1415 domain-containing protein [Congregibacter sp.]
MMPVDRDADSQEAQLIAATQRWVQDVVIGFNLCPFARKPVEAGDLRYQVEWTTEPAELLVAVDKMLDAMQADSRCETALIIHPHVLGDFLRYNDFLGRCDALLRSKSLDGVFQIASFHPQYQFADTLPDDPENYSNRSPYPMLHVLREASVEQAVDAHPDVHAIPESNIAKLRELGTAQLAATLQACLDHEH